VPREELKQDKGLSSFTLERYRSAPASTKISGGFGFSPARRGGRKGGGQVGACALGRRPWGRTSTRCKHLKTRFKQKIRPNMLKNAYFLSTITSLSSSFLALNAFYHTKRDRNNYSKCSVFASSALLHLFFHIKLCSFC